MRYIRRATITHTLCDDMVIDEVSIKKLFNSLQSRGLTFSIQVTGYPLYDKVRVMAVNDLDVKVKITQQTSSLLKDFFYNEIASVAVDTHPDKMIKINPKASTRWNSLDLSDEWIDDIDLSK